MRITKLPQNVLDAVAFKAVVGDLPPQARPETRQLVEQIASDPDVTAAIVRRNRLAKAVTWLKRRGFIHVDKARSTVKEVFLTSAHGLEALATKEGEVIVGDESRGRFFNGE